jgi:hypothetical protein
MQRRKELKLQAKSHAHKSTLAPIDASASFNSPLGTPDRTQSKERTSILQIWKALPKLKNLQAPRVHPTTLAALEVASKLAALVKQRLNSGFKRLGSSPKARPGGEMRELKGVVATLKTCISGVASLSHPPVALAKCPKCSYQGLTLLTSSTKEDLSPRLIDKIKAVLPASHYPSEASHEFKHDLRPKVQLREEGFELAKPEQKMSLNDISVIQPDQSAVDSFEILKRRSGGAQREPVLFDVISDSTQGRPLYDKECSLPSHNSTLRIPRLNISDLVPSTGRRLVSTESFKSLSRSSVEARLSSSKVVDLRVVKCLISLAEIVEMRLRRTFDLVFLSRNKAKDAHFEFSCEESSGGIVTCPY